MTDILKNGFTIIGLLVIAGLGYYLFVLEGKSELSGSERGSINEAQVVSEQFLREIAKIKNIDLSGDIFVDERFRSFVEFSQPVEPLPVGRDNPFAPVE